MKIGFGGELASVAAALAAVAIVFPFLKSTTETSPADGGAAKSSFAFITLNADEEAAAVRAARSSWKSPGSPASERARLSCDELPEAREPEAIGDADRTRTRRPADIDWRPPPLPPGLAAPKPPADEDPETAAPLPFPREKMLQLP